MQAILKPELRIAASPELLARGCVTLIGLQEVRNQAAARWPRMRAAIHAHLEMLLHQALGPTAFYTALDDISYLVTIPGAAALEAQIVSLRVAYDLHRHFLGRCDVSQLHIARATKLEGDALHCEEAQGADLVRLGLQAGLDIPKDRIADISATGTAKILQHAPSTGTGESGSHRFVPIWDAQNAAITTYRCINVGEGIASEGDSPQAKLRADLAAHLSRIRFATDVLSRKVAAGERFLLGLPLPYDLLGSPIARMEIASLFRNLPAEIRPYLQCEISELPLGVPQSRLSELAAMLRPFCRAVAACLPAHIPSYAAYQGAGLNAIGISFSQGMSISADVFSESFKLAAAASRQRIRSFVADVPNVEALLSLVSLKVNMISGPVIGFPVAEPGPVCRLSLQEIVDKVLAVTLQSYEMERRRATAG